VAVLGAVNAIACAPVIRHGPDRQDVPWPVYLGSAAHDVSAAEHLDALPRVRWRRHAGRDVRGAPAVGQNIVAVGTTERMVVLLGADSGYVIWDRRLAGTIRGGPLLTADRVYAASEEAPTGRVYALALNTGKVVWSRRAGDVAAPLALGGGTLYAATGSGEVLALDPDKGDVRWRRRLAGSFRAAPVPTPSGVVVATTADTLYLLDAASGDVRRKAPAPGAVLATPASAGDRVYVATDRGIVAAVDAATLDTVWTADVGSGVFGSPALARDTLFVLTREGRLVTIPVADPAARHAVELGIIAVAGPTPLADGVLAADVAGVIHCVDPVTGAERWRVKVTGPVEQPPVVRDGRLIVIADRGDVVAYQ